VRATGNLEKKTVEEVTEYNTNEAARKEKYYPQI
jgi:hypothetical protein